MNIQILKQRNGTPTVILVDGRRYILDPHTKVTKKQLEKTHKFQSADAQTDN
ncbi:hypothetical protein PP175_14415 [Aneurinibacillus sp. Ricciae_BoGa-3]|uniref:hypothetical protein n=1 Tax=Aneurinibacillus sp. Ricciae_BoGa-3 TaxID=3022697 RepID=UPI0023408C48|nr:hypothetical protein [Aneurinibacillus sp. Ricciae_BoGa-3]WCK52626.1 hypothetical protein PP175_14415 [Aneurinibacillus sp. Ricciae_BoGa-3]